MSDSRLNKTGLQYFYNRLKTVFASKSAFETLEGRVDGIVATGGEPNVIETVKRNGTALTVTNKAVDVEVPILTVKRNGTALTPDSNKAVDITVPTAVSALTNDSGFQTSQQVQTAITNSGYQANVIESIKVNGTTQTITSKAVDITMPTAVSDLTNDSGFQTAAQVQTAIGTAIASAYKYKGSVATLNDLPNSPSTGDVYDVQTTGMNYAWNGSAWDALGQLIDTSVLWTTTNLTAITTAEIDAIVV